MFLNVSGFLFFQLNVQEIYLLTKIASFLWFWTLCRDRITKCHLRDEIFFWFQTKFIPKILLLFSCCLQNIITEFKIKTFSCWSHSTWESLLFNKPTHMSINLNNPFCYKAIHEDLLIGFIAKWTPDQTIFYIWYDILSITSLCGHLSCYH